jgi:hypothetical protein
VSEYNDILASLEIFQITFTFFQSDTVAISVSIFPLSTVKSQIIIFHSFKEIVPEYLTLLQITTVHLSITISHLKLIPSEI